MNYIQGYCSVLIGKQIPKGGRRNCSKERDKMKPQNRQRIRMRLSLQDACFGQCAESAGFEDGVSTRKERAEQICISLPTLGVLLNLRLVFLLKTVQ